MKKTKSAPTIFREFFEKHPKVKFISWEQYGNTYGFHADPWSVRVNGKNVSLDGYDKLKPAERKAAFELLFFAQPFFVKGGVLGIRDVTDETPSLVNTSDLFRAMFGDDVIVTIGRDGSIEYEPSGEAREGAYITHISTCKECSLTTTEDMSQLANIVVSLCEEGRKLAQALAGADEREDAGLWAVLPYVIGTNAASGKKFLGARASYAVLPAAKQQNNVDQWQGERKPAVFESLQGVSS